MGGVDRFVTAQVWLQRVGAYTAIPDLIRQRGVDPRELMQAAGLAPDDLDDPDAHVPFTKIARLLHQSAWRTGSPHLGLLAGRAWHLADLGLIGDLMRHSQTLGEALRTLVSNEDAHGEGGLAFLWIRDGVAELGYAIFGGGSVGTDQMYDAVMAATSNFLHELCGPDWSPSEVYLPHAGPADSRHYRTLFGIAPHFDREYCALRFPEAFLDREIAGADSELRRQAADRIRTLAPVGLLQSVYRTLRLQLLTGNCSGDRVAAALSMHRRKLNRHLREQGTTYQRCLDQVRFEVACQLLATSRVSLDDVGATLGYASVSSFMRTFRRWSGTTPGQWRRMSDEQARDTVTKRASEAAHEAAEA